MKVKITKSPKETKRLVAVFTSTASEQAMGWPKTRTVHFGFEGGSAYPDHKNPVTKRNYLARHIVNEDWDDFMSAGALSRWILWNKTTIRESIADFKRRFKLD